MKGQSEKKVFNTTTLLIALCWVVYTCSYLGSTLSAYGLGLIADMGG